MIFLKYAVQENCKDRIDNDCDGLIDRKEDPDCFGGGGSSEICDDGTDNDGDGDIDCFDSDCIGDSSCPAEQKVCNDGIDNDNDGKIDCADKKDCGKDPAC